MVRASKITDGMAIRAAHSLAEYARRRGIDAENIVPRMDEADVFAHEAAEVADQAVAEGVARLPLGREEVFARAKADIDATRALCHKMMDDGSIPAPPAELIQQALDFAAAQVGK